MNDIFKLLTIKNAILAMLVLGVVYASYVLGSSFLSRSHGALDSYALGAMSSFRSVSQPPEQPGLPLTLENGDETSLIELRGKVVLVNFWATWCAPCVVEMPMLNTLERDMGSDQFEVVAVSMDTTLEAAREFYIQHELSDLTLYHDASFRAAMLAGARGLPLSVLYDPYGQEIGRLDGEADWASDEAKALIQAAIERYPFTDEG